MSVIVKYNREQAEEYIIKRCRTMARLEAMDNGIPPPTDEEMALALEDGLNYINSYPPHTSLTPEDLLNSTDNNKYVTLVCWATLKFTFEMLIAYISANLMDVVIDEFAISSRLNEYSNLMTMYEGKLENSLAKDKPIMGSVIRGFHRTTAPYQSITGRMNPYILNRYVESMRRNAFLNV